MEKIKDKEIERAIATIKRHNLSKKDLTGDSEIDYCYLKTLMFLDRFNYILDFIAIIGFIVCSFVSFIYLSLFLLSKLLN